MESELDALAHSVVPSYVPTNNLSVLPTNDPSEIVSSIPTIPRAHSPSLPASKSPSKAPKSMKGNKAARKDH